MITSLLAASVLLQKPSHTFTIEDGHFQLDGKPFQILAGEMHYARIPHQLWRQRIRMAKAMGLNSVAIYVFWNFQEPERGKFEFGGDADVSKFIDICKDEGMYVLFRPGPYVCAEWEFGGFPYWLLNIPGLTLRADNPQFLAETKLYFKELAKRVVPHQITHGGNVILVQAENEYGSYGHDHNYMAKMRDMLKELGYDVPIYVAEGGGQLANAWVPGTVAGENGGSWPNVVKTVDKYTPGGPYMVPEFYPGWLDHWGEPKSLTSGDVTGYSKLVSNGVSVSMYMFHGGTNFGFYNGANFGGNYEPHITSYDYDAPLDEAGRPRKKYFGFRTAIENALHTTLPPVPPAPRTMAIPRFSLERAGSLFGNLPAPLKSETTKDMESLGQDYGFVLYRTHLKTPGKARLEISEVRDFATVMVDGKIVATIDRRRKEHGCQIEVPQTGARLDILVENGGRINYGGKLPDNRHGITKNVSLDGEELRNWEMFKLPLKSPNEFKFDHKSEGPGFYTGTFQVQDPAETFLDLRGWTKGVVWVNGHNLGRYWWIGPQQTLYLPSPWLKRGENKITVLETQEAKSTSIEGLSEPILTDLRAEPKLEPAPKRPRAPLANAPVLHEADLVVSSKMAPGDAPQDFRFARKAGRYLVLRANSSLGGDDFVCLSEIELLDEAGKTMSRAKWKVAFVDSEETDQDDGSAENLFDSDVDTFWHSVWSKAHTPNPHTVVIDLGQETKAAGVRLTPRPGDQAAKLKDFTVYLGAVD